MTSHSKAPSGMWAEVGEPRLDTMAVERLFAQKEGAAAASLTAQAQASADSKADDGRNRLYMESG